MLSADCWEDEQPLNVARLASPSEARVAASCPLARVAMCALPSARIVETSLLVPTTWKRLDASMVYLLWPVVVKLYADETVHRH